MTSECTYMNTHTHSEVVYGLQVHMYSTSVRHLRAALQDYGHRLVFVLLWIPCPCCEQGLVISFHVQNALHFFAGAPLRLWFVTTLWFTVAKPHLSWTEPKMWQNGDKLSLMRIKLIVGAEITEKFVVLATWSAPCGLSLKFYLTHAALWQLWW